MPISDLFGLLAKRQTSPDKYLASSVNVVTGGGQHGAARPPFSPDRGVRAFRSWVYAAASINANAVAALPLRLYAKADEVPTPTRPISRRRKAYMLGDLAGDARPSDSVLRKASAYGDDLEEVVGSHPVLDVLASANPFLNGFDLAVLRILYGELTGNAYLHPVLDEATGTPAELWPLGSQYVEVIPCEDEFIKGYVYGIDASRKQIFETDEVIHFRRPNPGNLHYGLGKVEAAYGTILANQAIHEMDLSTFENSARPDYAVVVKGTPTGDQLDRFQSQVETRLKGTRKDGSFITVTGDVQFTPLNFPPKDLAGREEIVEEIAAVFGVPVSMLKANDPNLASAQTGFAQWREGTILPLCRMDEQELNQSLLPLFGLEDTHVLCYDNPVPADRTYELQERQTAVAGGWRTPNEARIEEGREPIEDPFADKLLIGGQPLGGSADPGLGLASLEESEADDLGPVETASAILADVRGRRISSYVATKLLQRAGWARATADRMVAAELKASGPTVRAVVRNEQDLYETAAEAEAVARAIGCKGHHEHEVDGRTLYMPCERMETYSELTGRDHAGEDDLRLTPKAVEDVDLQPTEEMAELADRGLRLREEHGRGGTEVGVARARDIRNRENLSPETVGRMANFFSRHRVDLEAPAAKPGHEDYPSAGVVAWLLWGGDPGDPDGAGTAWATRKLEELEGAREKAEGDRVSSTPAKPSERIEGSDDNPEGSASGTRGGIEISEAQETALENKRDEHNEKHGDDPAKKVNLGMLKAVYRRGAGAFSTSHRPGMSRQQWSMARVNAFLYLVRNGRPKDEKYVGDNDLLPKEHPKYAPKEDAKKACGCGPVVKAVDSALGYDPEAWLVQKSTSSVYEWPDETKWYRLAIEGLIGDYDRLRPKAVDEPDYEDADEDIRSGERKTPAMEVADLTEKMLDDVRIAIERTLRDVRPKSADEGLVARILALLEEKGSAYTKALRDALLAAAMGGESVGTARINELLRAAGEAPISTPSVSESLKKLMSARSSVIAGAVIEDTVRSFAEGIDADFNIDDEIRRLEQRLGVPRARAEVIARTESAQAYHEGQIDAWEESGQVSSKEFLVAPGACQYCKAVDKRFGADGGRAIPIDAPMVRAGETIEGTKGGSMKVSMSSCGIVHPNCRCDFRPVLRGAL